MNWEAGKLLRTGVSEEDALATVTLNAARVVAIDERVGSLEPGKDADFVIWSGHPLSQFTRAEQTWVDGRRYFSLEDDRLLRERVASERAQLTQLVLELDANGGGR
jgi:imidazolonepropionase-like amidohydrolase